MCEIERRLSCRSEVWIINLEQILHRVLLFLFLTLSTYLFAGYRLATGIVINVRNQASR